VATRSHVRATVAFRRSDTRYLFPQDVLVGRTLSETPRPRPKPGRRVDERSRPWASCTCMLAHSIGADSGDLSEQIGVCDTEVDVPRADLRSHGRQA
jgi:hypothetical protein